MSPNMEASLRVCVVWVVNEYEITDPPIPNPSHVATTSTLPLDATRSASGPRPSDVSNVKRAVSTVGFACVRSTMPSAAARRSAMMSESPLSDRSRLAGTEGIASGASYVYVSSDSTATRWLSGCDKYSTLRLASYAMSRMRAGRATLCVG